MNTASDKQKTLLICLALALVTLAVYWQVSNYDFLNYDDANYISRNEHVRTGLSLDNIVWAFTSYHYGNWYPLTWISHMLDCHLFGLKPGWHHIVNLLFHIANTLLLFAVLKRMTSAVWRSAFVAALFAVHPLHVESVAWIAERKDVLSTLFSLLAMAAYVSYAKNRSIGWYVLALLLFALGLMAKPMLVTLPFVFLLLDFWPLERFQYTQSSKNKAKSPFSFSHWRVLLLEKTPFFALSILSGIVTIFAQRSGGAITKMHLLPVRFRLLNALFSYTKYIGKMFWPGRLAIFYPHTVNVFSIRYAVAAAVLLAAITFVAIYLRKKHKYVLFGWLWYLGILVPVIGLVQVGSQAMADRYTYVPLTGLFIMLTWGTPELLAKWRHRKAILIALATAALLFLSIRTYFHQRCWLDSKTVFKHTLNVAGNSTIANIYLAQALVDEGNVAAALAHFKEALRLSPNKIDLLNNLAWLLATYNDDRYRNPKEAIELTEHACRLTNYKDPVILDTTAVAYASAGNFQKAIAFSQKALAQSSGDRKLTKEIHNHMLLFTANKPYIEPATGKPFSTKD
ncbi:MAG: tetratricopeptide repeat protein [Sedimentisphaerales bacterium]|nr:tetratricopeptide repeat protein [Sedimentisphaerales bacterium]